MEQQRNRPSGWYFIIPVAILVFGCGLAAAFFALGVGGIVDWAVDLNGDIQGMQRVVMPGSADLQLTDPGHYAVFYEYRSTVDGEAYRGFRTLPALTCDLVARDSGARIEVKPAEVQQANYELGPENRAGVWLYSFDVEDPGTYAISCSYRGDRSGPEVVLAVGSNVIWDALQAFPPRFASLGVSGLVCCGSAVLALLAALAVVVARQGKAPAAS